MPVAVSCGRAFPQIGVSAIVSGNVEVTDRPSVLDFAPSDFGANVTRAALLAPNPLTDVDVGVTEKSATSLRVRV